MWLRDVCGRELVLCRMECRLCFVPYSVLVDRDLDGYYWFASNPHCPDCGHLGIMRGVWTDDVPQDAQQPSIEA